MRLLMKSTEYLVVYSKSNSWDCCPLVADSNVTDRYAVVEPAVDFSKLNAVLIIKE